MDINHNVYVGRLADNVSYSPATERSSSRAVGRLIVNRPPARDGQRRYDVIPIVAWGKHADNIAQYTSKGKELGIVGQMRTHSVPPQKEGDEWKNYFEVQVDSISFGRDSNQAKLMKALQGGASLPTSEPQQSSQPQQAAAVAQVGALDIKQLLAANPQLKTQLEAIARGDGAQQQASPETPANGSNGAAVAGPEKAEESELVAAAAPLDETEEEEMSSDEEESEEAIDIPFSE